MQFLQEGGFPAVCHCLACWQPTRLGRLQRMHARQHLILLTSILVCRKCKWATYICPRSPFCLQFSEQQPCGRPGCCRNLWIRPKDRAHRARAVSVFQLLVQKVYVVLLQPCLFTCRPNWKKRGTAVTADSADPVGSA